MLTLPVDQWIGNAAAVLSGNSVRLNFCMAVELSDASGQYA